MTTATVPSMLEQLETEARERGLLLRSVHDLALVGCGGLGLRDRLQDRRPSLAVSDQVEAQVGGHPVQPGLHLELGIEEPRFLHGLDEDLLRDVLGVGRVAHELERATEDLPLVLLEEAREFSF